ncbi:MAG TPA: hypothetical protein V6D22_19625 [Candidatus Obscuribacterales bacterium]
MLNRVTVALLSGLSVIGYTTLQMHVPAQCQSEASSEAASEATSEATSEASSEASVESGLVFGRTGYQIYQPWPPLAYQPLGPSGYPWQTFQFNQPWPPLYMQPTAQNGYPLYSAQDKSWIYWDGSQPNYGYASYPSPNFAPLPAPFPAAPAPAPAPRSKYGFARIIPRSQGVEVPLPMGVHQYRWVRHSSGHKRKHR